MSRLAHCGDQVMDTPGLHDTEVGESVIAERITRSLLATHPGPHVIILCLSCDQRFTEEEVLVCPDWEGGREGGRERERESERERERERERETIMHC